MSERVQDKSNVAVVSCIYPLQIVTEINNPECTVCTPHVLIKHRFFTAHQENYCMKIIVALHNEFIVYFTASIL